MTTLTRRQMMQTLAVTPLMMRSAAAAAQDAPYGGATLPSGIRSRLVAGVNGITMHALEAGSTAAARSQRSC